MARTETESTLSHACVVDSIQEAFTFIMEHFDDVDPEFISISATFSDVDDFQAKRFEVVVRGRVTS